MNMKKKSTLMWVSLIIMIGYSILIMYSMSEFDIRVIRYLCGAIIMLCGAFFCQQHAMKFCALLIKGAYAFYVVGIAGMLMLQSDYFGTYQNGVRRWLRIGSFVIIRPEVWLVFFTLIAVAVSIKNSAGQKENFRDIYRKEIEKNLIHKKYWELFKAFLADYGSIIFPIISIVLILKYDGFITYYLSIIVIALFVNIRRIKKRSND